MNRKKITKAALSGLVAVTMVPAMAAPLVANAEGNDATVQSKEQYSATVYFIVEGESTPVHTQVVPVDANDSVDVAQYCPAGYQIVAGQKTVITPGSNSDIFEFLVEPVGPDVNRVVNIFYMAADGNQVGMKSIPFKDLDVDGNGNIHLSEIPEIAGYTVVSSINGETGDLLNQWASSNTIEVLVQEAAKEVKMNIKFVNRAGGVIGGGDYFLPEGVQNYSILEQYLPEGYKLAVGGDFTVVEGGSADVIVESIYGGTTLNFQFVDANGNVVGGGDVIVDEDKDGIFNGSEIASIIPEGYKNDSFLGDFNVADYIGGSNVVVVDKIYKASIIKLEFVNEAGDVVGGGDFFVDEDGNGIFNWKEVTAPAGYEISTKGDDFVSNYSSEDATQVKVTKINKGTIINVTFVDPQGNNLGGGDYVVDLDGDGIANYSELDLPVGYKLNVTGDFFVEEGGHYTVTLNHAGASIIHVIFKSEGGKTLGGGDFFVDEDGDGIFNYSELTLPEGYELIETGDAFVDTEKTYEITLNKEIEGTIINVVFVDEEGNNLGGGDFFVDPDDDGIANYSELALPEGYELIETGDFFVTPGKSYTIVLRKTGEKEGTAELVVKYYIQKGGTTAVVGEDNAYTAEGKIGDVHQFEVSLKAPKGFKLVNDEDTLTVDVEYGQRIEKYVQVEAVDQTEQPGEDENTDTPSSDAQTTNEESKKTNGTDTGVAMPLAGAFGTMSVALGGLVALLRRKQK